jgi:hypothetical protein
MRTKPDAHTIFRSLQDIFTRMKTRGMSVRTKNICLSEGYALVVPSIMLLIFCEGWAAAQVREKSPLAIALVQGRYPGNSGKKQKVPMASQSEFIGLLSWELLRLSYAPPTTRWRWLAFCSLRRHLFHPFRIAKSPVSFGALCF